MIFMKQWIPECFVYSRRRQCWAHRMCEYKQDKGLRLQLEEANIASMVYQVHICTCTQVKLGHFFSELFPLTEWPETISRPQGVWWSRQRGKAREEQFPLSISFYLMFSRGQRWLEIYNLIYLERLNLQWVWIASWQFVPDKAVLMLFTLSVF